MSVADGTCPVCNHDLRESYNDSPHTRWECTHCSWGWTEHNHDAARADGGRAEENASVSQFVTVFEQTKDWGDNEKGDRYICHGEDLDRRYQIDDKAEDFVPVAKPIAVISVGTELHEYDLTQWCNSDAGKHVLSKYFPEMEASDPTLPDVEIGDEKEVTA